MVFEQSLRKRGIRLFAPLDVQRILGVSAVAARFLIHRYSRRSALVKLRNGLYALADRLPSDLAVANRLYPPSYLSFEFALWHHHLMPEAVYVITSATTRPTQTFTALGKRFEYHRLKPAAFTGYEPIQIAGDTVLMATPEKALADTLYFVDLGRKRLPDRLVRRPLNWARVESYGRLFQRATLLARIRGLR